jgi:nitroreductase
MNYKKVILRYTPTFAHKLIRDAYFAMRMLPDYVYDFRRFLFYSGMNKSRWLQSERAASLTLFYHQVEKGLSLPNPRPGFGMKVIPRLLDEIDAYFTDFGISEPAATAFAAMSEYVAFHERIGHDAQYVQGRLAAIVTKHGLPQQTVSSWSGGVTRVRRADLDFARSSGFRGFFESRHSVRNFSGGTIPQQDIRLAVEIAQKTPSVCNRQAWKVHAFSDKEHLPKLLEIQGCSRGFGDRASAVLVITCDLSFFVDVGERYQAWIDGGMFSMSICLALHDLGYGTCCLNWSKERSTDKKLRVAAGIPGPEQIIMLIAAGTLPEEFNVARSTRSPVDRCLVVH